MCGRVRVFNFYIYAHLRLNIYTKCMAAPPPSRMPTSDCKYLRMLSKWESRYNTVWIIYYSFNVIFLVTRIHRQGCPGPTRPGSFQWQLKMNAIYIFPNFAWLFLFLRLRCVLMKRNLRPPAAVNYVPSTSIFDLMASKLRWAHITRMVCLHLRKKVNDQPITPAATYPKNVLLPPSYF